MIRHYIIPAVFFNPVVRAAWLAQLGERRSAGGRGFKPRPDQHSGSLNNWEESATFVMTSANG